MKKKKAADNGLVDHILELMGPMGGVNAKRMFGGVGFFRGGKMFALLADDELYFKTTPQTRPTFEERGLKPFTYQRKGKKVSLSYYQAPEGCFDSPQAMKEWGEKAIQG